ncbi:hypothetical protein VNO78_12541 [Psophocarpus tetragonolobus]|uniref:Uncharacterized protein n=1 Tax=Psophocarpus tetragonolobus TaxID=3891 RepID=A0AAN9SW60_PSOTE
MRQALPESLSSPSGFYPVGECGQFGDFNALITDMWVTPRRTFSSLVIQCIGHRPSGLSHRSVVRVVLKFVFLS